MFSSSAGRPPGEVDPQGRPWPRRIALACSRCFRAGKRQCVGGAGWASAVLVPCPPALASPARWGQGGSITGAAAPPFRWRLIVVTRSAAAARSSSVARAPPSGLIPVQGNDLGCWVWCCSNARGHERPAVRVSPSGDPIDDHYYDARDARKWWCQMRELLWRAEGRSAAGPCLALVAAASRGPGPQSGGRRLRRLEIRRPRPVREGFQQGVSL